MTCALFLFSSNESVFIFQVEPACLSTCHCDTNMTEVAQVEAVDVLDVEDVFNENDESENEDQEEKLTKEENCQTDSKDDNIEQIDENNESENEDQEEKINKENSHEDCDNDIHIDKIEEKATIIESSEPQVNGVEHNDSQAPIRKRERSRAVNGVSKSTEKENQDPDTNEDEMSELTMKKEVGLFLTELM